MMAGANGSLAAIVSATFKLSPLPEASKTVTARTDSAVRALAAIVRFTERQREPVQFDVRAGRGADADEPLNIELLVRHATVSTAVDHAAAETLSDLSGLGIAGELLASADEAAAWREHARLPWVSRSSSVARLSWLPADLPRVVEAIDRATRPAAFHFQGRASIGTGLIRIDGDHTAQARIIDRLRQEPLLGHVVVIDGSPALRALVDAWGVAGAEARLWSALVNACDPHGVLNAGRGPM